MRWARTKPYYRGDGFALTTVEAQGIVYSEGRKQWSVPARSDDTPPLISIPRPEVWDYVVPQWLRGRYGTVMPRLVAHSGSAVVFDSDDQHSDTIRALKDTTESTRGACVCCDVDIVAPKHERPLRPGEFVLDIRSTQAAVEARLADGRFEVIRADVPVGQMLAVLDRESMYTIVAFLRCTVSRETIFWGLAIRGDPIYRHMTATTPFSWPWDPGRPQVDNAPAAPGVG